MKKNTHPTYGPVKFEDRSTGEVFEIGSTLGDPSRETRRVKIDVSSSSHPFWTGGDDRRATEGRVAAFHRRYGTTR